MCDEQAGQPAHPDARLRRAPDYAGTAIHEVNGTAAHYRAAGCAGLRILGASGGQNHVRIPGEQGGTSE